MKSIIKPLAAAIGLALASAAAHAQLATPAMGTATSGAPASSQLILAIWNNVGAASEIVSLNYTYADLTAANLNVNSATSPFTTAVNPLTGTGSVYQLSFGIVPTWSTNFANPATESTQFLVAASNGTSADVTAATQQAIQNSFLTDINNSVTSVTGANWTGTAGTAGYFVDATGTTPLSVNASGALMQSGGLGTTTQQFGAAVGSSLAFYNVVSNGTRGLSPATQTQFANAAGAGFWYLSTSGQLTYNVPSGTVSAVPLPAAVWLLASGVAGLGTIGRRRRAAAA